jgi:hypothetical protein
VDLGDERGRANKQVIVNKSMSPTTPKVDAVVMFDEIGVVFDRDQYRDALSVVDVFHFYRRTHQYHKYRPADEEFEANPARARLKFAMKAIAAEVHERHRRWTWEYLAERRDMRKKYVEIYVRKLALTDAKPLPVEVSDTPTPTHVRMGLIYRTELRSQKWRIRYATRISDSSDQLLVIRPRRMQQLVANSKPRKWRLKHHVRHGVNGFGVLDHRKPKAAV